MTASGDDHGGRDFDDMVLNCICITTEFQELIVDWKTFSLIGIKSNFDMLVDLMVGRSSEIKKTSWGVILLRDQHFVYYMNYTICCLYVQQRCLKFCNV